MTRSIASRLEAVQFWVCLPFWLLLSLVTISIDYAARMWRACR